MSLADGVYSLTNFSTKTSITSPTDVGAPLFGKVYEGSFAQHWNITSKGNNTYFLQSLDPTFYAFASPPGLQGQAINAGNAPLKWTIESVGMGRYSVRNDAGLVWQLTSAGVDAKVTLGPAAGSDAQSWTFTRRQ